MCLDTRGNFILDFGQIFDDLAKILKHEKEIIAAIIHVTFII